MTKQDTSGIKIIYDNKKARFNYHIIEVLEAGIVLSGAEIKSVRQGEVSLAESYVRPEGNAVYLLNAYIKPYSFSADREYIPTRKRKLLLHKREIEKLRGRVEAKGLTAVPLKLYLKKGLAKLEIALAQGKSAPDKREGIKKREAQREMARMVKEKK